MPNQPRIDRFDGEFRFLSNFDETPVIWLGVEWPSAEHPYQAAKDPVRLRERAEQWAEMSPGQAKRAGQKLTLRQDWEQVKLAVMQQIVFAKFNGNAELLEHLLQLRGYELVEGNHWGDTYWGVCRGQGENHLGRILMRTRDRLGRALCGWQIY